jgi:hypothetical protein
MLDMSEILLTGDRELKAKLKRLPRQLQNKVLRQSVSMGLTPLKSTAVRLAKQKFKSDTIAKMIRKKSGRSRRGYGVYGMIYVSKDSKSRSDSGKPPTVNGRVVPFSVIAQILEFGHKDGRVPAKSYMREARNMAGGKAMSRMKMAIRSKISSIGGKR